MPVIINSNFIPYTNLIVRNNDDDESIVLVFTAIEESLPDTNCNGKIKLDCNPDGITGLVEVILKWKKSCGSWKTVSSDDTDDMITIELLPDSGMGILVDTIVVTIDLPIVTNRNEFRLIGMIEADEDTQIDLARGIIYYEGN